MPISPVAFPLTIIFVFAFLQIIPLPLSFLKVITPQAHFFHLIEGSGARPISISIPDTVYSMARVATLLVFSTIVAKILSTDGKKWRQTLIDTIIFISAALIFVSIALTIIGAKSWLYGTLSEAGFLFRSIIVNPNHAAAYFGISAILSLASIYSTNFNRKRIFYGSLFFIHSVAVVSTLSRGGILSFVVSLIFFALLKKIKPEKEKKKRKLFLTVSSLVLTLFIAFYAGLALLEKEFDFKREGYFSKIEETVTAKEYFQDFYVTGSGLGSFSKVYSYYQDNPERKFTEFENEPVQFVLENGIFFSLLIFGMLLWLVARRWKSSKYSAGFMTVFVFVLLHNTVDFNLHNFSTLFPLVAVAAMGTEPVEFKGKIKTFTAVVLILVSLFLLLIALTEKGRKAVGYSENISYKELIYNYPADYSIPMYEAIDKLNSQSRAEAGKYASSAMLKAPNYYFTHYLAGNCLLRLGATQEALVFYKKSLELSKEKYSEIVRKIYKDLKSAGVKEKMVGILSLEHKNIGELEKFVFETSGSDDNFLHFIYENEELFFLSAIKIKLERKEFESAESLILKSEKSLKETDVTTKGQLLIFKGMIFEQKKEFAQAFKLYIEGATLTENFFDYLKAGYSALQLDSTSIVIAEKGMKNHLLKSPRNIYHYYKWLSKKEFKNGNFVTGLKYLEKAADNSKSPQWRLELANRYSRRGMHYAAIKNLVQLQKENPRFRKEVIEQRVEEEKKKLTDKEMESFKELMLR
ncbi:MAG: O-antigen ligase family protein [bacterium]